MAAWQEKPQVQEAVAEFREALATSPIDEAVALGGLTRIVRVIDSIREARRKPEEASAFLNDLSKEGAHAADEEGNLALSTMFESQGWDAALGVEKKAETPKVQPTDTSTVPMSSAKR